jgi:translocator protein
MDLTLFATYLIACGAAAATGALFSPGEWYLRLSKPVWTPPGWVFPLAWTTLYICMSVAAAKIAVLPGTGLALALWSVQIAFNTLWTPVFFGLHRIRAAMVVMVGLWLSVAATTLAFALHSFSAGSLMLPYLLWVTIAAALNLSVMKLNPGADPKPA